jgi:hypothetical protein
MNEYDEDIIINKKFLPNNTFEPESTSLQADSGES